MVVFVVDIEVDIDCDLEEDCDAVDFEEEAGFAVEETKEDINGVAKEDVSEEGVTVAGTLFGICAGARLAFIEFMYPVYLSAAIVESQLTII